MKFLLILSLTLVGCSSMKQKKDQELSSKLTSASPQEITATVTIADMGDEIRVVTMAQGLKPNSSHGFHIHQFGKCEGPDYKSAGDHFNPHETQHSSPSVEDRHLGDLGNLQANAKGEAASEISITKTSKKDFELLVGKALIIHANPDNFASQPSGKSGESGISFFHSNSSNLGGLV